MDLVVLAKTNIMIPIQYKKEEVLDAIYKLKRMRTRYRLSFWFPFFKEELKTDVGFCYCYHSIFDSNMKPYFDNDLFRMSRQVKGCINIGFWFKEGLIRPRLKTIRKAINYYKQVIK